MRPPTERPNELRTEAGRPARNRELVQMADAILDTTGVRRDRELLREIVLATLGFATENSSRLDLKIARSAISEMAEAFRVFAPYRDVPKVTIFGSARTSPSDTLYVLARDLASRLAAAGCMVVTGAGPGIMAAGSEGAGRDMTLGVNIQLPFETTANIYIDPEDKLVEMKYFFTRKLMLMKESRGYLVLPGGFGTLDECFELLTLIQTGKAEPAPVVLIDIPDHHYWQHWEAFLNDQVYARGFADVIDSVLYRIADTPSTAIEELLGFHRNYQSRRFIGKTMVIRLLHAPERAGCSRACRSLRRHLQRERDLADRAAGRGASEPRRPGFRADRARIQPVGAESSATTDRRAERDQLLSAASGPARKPALGLRARRPLRTWRPAARSWRVRRSLRPRPCARRSKRLGPLQVGLVADGVDRARSSSTRSSRRSAIRSRSAQISSMLSSLVMARPARPGRG